VRLEIVPNDLVVRRIFSLYNLCKAFQCLPESGGIRKQASITMEYFLVIESQIATEREMKMQQSKAESLTAQVRR